MKEFAPQPVPQRFDIGKGRVSRYTRKQAHGLHVLQQDDGGNDGQRD